MWVCADSVYDMKFTPLENSLIKVFAFLLISLPHTLSLNLFECDNESERKCFPFAYILCIHFYSVFKDTTKPVSNRMI